VRGAVLFLIVLVMRRWITTLVPVLLAAMAAAALSAAWGAAAVSRWWKGVAGTPRDEVGVSLDAGGLLADSWPLMASTIVGFAGTQADLWFVSAFAPADQVGLYGAVMRLMFLLSLPLVVQNITVSSSIAELWARGEKVRLQQMLRTTATAASIPTLLLVVVYVFAGRQLLHVLFGPSYAATGDVLAILSIGRLAGVFTGACGLSLMMTNHQRLQLVINFVSVASLVAGAAWAGSRFGMTGVAVAFAVGIVLNNVSMLLAARYALGIWTHGYFTPHAFVRGIAVLRSGGGAAASAPLLT
jgi:O-antigen/teichoic acid export membrane protein